MFYLKTISFMVLLFMLFGCGNSVERKNQAKSHYTLGLSHLQSGSPTMALKEFMEAAKIDSGDPEIQEALAQAYQVKRAYKEAERHYKRALSLSDNNPRYLNNLGSLYLNMGEWDKAIVSFRKASEDILFMRTEVALLGMGYAYFRKGEYSTAISAYQEARAIAPEYAPISLRLGEVFYARGQDAAARHEFETAIVQSPRYTEAHYWLGMVAFREGQLTEAASEFRRVVELSPDSDWAQKSTTYLKTLP